MEENMHRSEMELVVGASTKSSLEKIGDLLSGSWDHTLDRDVRRDIRFIVDKLSASLNNRVNAGSHEAHDDEEWEQARARARQARDVAYDAEDFVNHIKLRLRQQPPVGGLVSAIRRALFLIATLPMRHSIATDIRPLMVRAELLGGDLQSASAGGGGGGDDDDAAGAGATQSDPLPAAVQDPVGMERAMADTRPWFTPCEQEPVGMERAMADIRPWFTACAKDPELRVLAILGCGGLGKTTLAKALQREFGGEFDSHATVLASREFNTGVFLRSLLKQIMPQLYYDGLQIGGNDGWKDDELQEKVEEQFLEKRYIVIIDDVWPVPSWESIWHSLPENRKGSRIIVTTRFPYVAQAICRQEDYVYACNPLNADDSHRLLETALGPGNQFSLRADSAASRILEKCGGLPLAIILVASLLADRLTTDSSSLTRACDSIISELGNGVAHHKEIAKRLFSLCFSDLQGDLKTCLLSLSIFPMGFTIRRKRLIRRWIVEGFITEKHEKAVDQVGEEAFKELIRRNMIKPVEISSTGKVKTFQVHNVILENIVYASKEENLITITDGCSTEAMPGCKIRWLSIHRRSSPLCAEAGATRSLNLSDVRSLTAFGAIKHLESLEILQVLDLEDCTYLDVRQLSMICKLYLLKYLSLRRVYINALPRRIGRLQYLETLDIRETNIQRLPRSACRFKRMVHLLCGDKNRGLQLELTKEIIEMSEIQTLSGIKPHGSSRAELEGIHDLTKLNKLKIYNLSQDPLFLSNSSSLRYLAIHDGFAGFHEALYYFSAPFLPHLHTLELSGKLFRVPRWIDDSMKCLEVLTLSLISLTTDSMERISKLPKLCCLTFSIEATERYASVLFFLENKVSESGGEIFVPAGGFDSLHTLRFSGVGLPMLSFLQGAMTGLQRLELRFRMLDGIYGLENLASLHTVHLKVSKRASQVAEEKVKQIQISVQQHTKRPAIICDRYSE